MPAAQSQARADGSRTLATPYARRLARQAGIDLHGLDGSGPRGRIKAADVERAIAAKGSAPRPSVVPAPAEASRAATFSAGVDIDITALLALTEQINGDLPDLHADLAHFVALAVAKVPGVFSEPPVIGLAASGDGGEGAASLLAGADCRTLSGVIAQTKNSATALDAPRRTERSGSTGHWMASRSFPPIRRPAGRHRSRSVQCARHSALTRTAAPRARHLSLSC